MKNNIAIAGSLSFLNLSEVFQLLGSNSSTGILRISSRYEENAGVIYFLNGNVNISKKVKQVGADNIFTSIINIFELKYGAYNSSKIKYNLKRIEEFQNSITVIEQLNDNVATIFAKEKSRLKKKGLAVSDFDLLIASIAIENNCILVTNNIKHFENISNLSIENWLN
jgi:tRNA(fMet)-specific endonuclease VapC